MDTEIQECKASLGGGAKRKLYFAEMGLRFVVIALSLGGALTTITGHQSVKIFGIVFSASYSSSSAFKYKVAADVVACGLTLLSLVLVILHNRPTPKLKNNLYLHLLNLVSLLLLLSGCSAAMAVGFVGKFGQPESGWIPICDRVAKFCNHMTMSIIISFLALICLLLLTVISALNLKSQQH